MRSVRLIVLAVVGVVSLGAALASAQTSTTDKAFEVVAVNGSKLVVKLPEGTREITVPDGFMFTVDGKQVPVSGLTPGMKGTATITTTTKTVPVTVTEVKDGTVTKAMGSTIVVQTADGYKMFTEGALDKRGVTILKDGQPANIADLRPGDKLSATIITSLPPKTVTEKEVNATTTKATAAAPAASSGATPSEGAALPKTASPLPLLALASLLCAALGGALTARRRQRA